MAEQILRPGDAVRHYFFLRRELGYSPRTAAWSTVMRYSGGVENYQRNKRMQAYLKDLDERKAKGAK